MPKSVVLSQQAVRDDREDEGIVLHVRVAPDLPAPPQLPSRKPLAAWAGRRDWHREVGDLKCEECGRITTHAIILPADDTWRDHAESIREIATGWVNNRLNEDDYRRIRQAWRQGTPQNPRKRHFWWGSDLDEARAAGQSHFRAICEVEIPVPQMESGEGTNTYAGDELVAPDQFHDVDLEDSETGLWWYEVDCTDCLYHSNVAALNRQRKALQSKIEGLAGKIAYLDAATVAHLLDQFNDAEIIGGAR